MTHGENILLADDPGKFADEIVKLLQIIRAAQANRRRGAAVGRTRIWLGIGRHPFRERTAVPSPPDFGVYRQRASRSNALRPKSRDPRRIADENSHNLS